MYDEWTGPRLEDLYIEIKWGVRLRIERWEILLRWW